MASLYVSKEQLATCAMEAHCQRAVFSAQRDTLEASRKKLRQETQKVQAKLHAQEMEIQRSVHEQQTLVERMREDFDIDVTDISGLRPMANETDRAISSSEVRAEMESLRLQLLRPMEQRSLKQAPVEGFNKASSITVIHLRR